MLDVLDVVVDMWTILRIERFGQDCGRYYCIALIICGMTDLPFSWRVDHYVNGCQTIR